MDLLSQINVKCDMYKNINTGYSYSDHDPVYVKFELNKELPVYFK